MLAIGLQFLESCSLADGIAFLEEMETGVIYADLAETFAQRMATEDPDGCIRWLSAISGSAYSDSIMQAFGAKVDPDLALQAARDGNLKFLPDDREHLLRCGLVTIGKKDFDRALSELALDYSDAKILGPVDSEYVAGAAVQFAFFNEMSLDAILLRLPELAKFSPSGKVGAAIGSNWAGRDPQACAAWVTANADGLGAADVSKGLMSAWTVTNPIKASRWLDDLPEGEVKQAGITALVNVLSSNSPDEALIWAEQLRDKKQRDRAVANILPRLKARSE